MSQLIEDYAIIGNNETAALVGRNGSIDWLCLPRFDDEACFAALLGTHENGRWIIEPKAEVCSIVRQYRPGTLVLETEFTTSNGRVVLIDCMDRRSEQQDVVRLVRGLNGNVSMQMELLFRFDYGTFVPWVSRLEDGRLRAVAGPDCLVLDTDVELSGEGMKTRAEFTVGAGQEVPFVLTWSKSYLPVPARQKASSIIAAVTSTWERWSAKFKSHGPYAEAVLRSLITLKALTHHKTGGVIAAATTSLPEEVGGVRNWDYRYCWLRDATFTLYALMEGGFLEEARAWRDWLLRAVAGSPTQMQIMYGVAGERRLTEFEVPHLTGYEASAPVRIGNAASEQFQLDVYGEVLDSFYQARRKGLAGSDAAGQLERALMKHVETIWQLPDDGIWEVRGPRRHFVHSKLMAWVAVDRAVRSIEEFGKPGPLDRWKKLRSEIHNQICRFGYSRDVNAFVQYYGSKQLDASVLMMPLVGFLPAEDERIKNTVAAVEKYLLRDGFVARYNTASNVDGLPGGEGTFLACSFWLADNYVLQGRTSEAKEIFDRLLAVRNDVGLLSEEYDPRERRQLGNFPQAFSHLALVNTAHNLGAIQESKPASHRSSRHRPTEVISNPDVLAPT
jgi:GH15 family glucan-1,4-alpha-glucosidase